MAYISPYRSGGLTLALVVLLGMSASACGEGESGGGTGGVHGSGGAGGFDTGGESVGGSTVVEYHGSVSGTVVDAIEAYLNYDKAAKVVLYCFTGPMSEIAGDELVARGYCNVSDMAAGAYTWEQLGYPYEQ